MQIKDQKTGAFCWEELGTTDANGAKNFYENIFGWKYNDMPMGNDMVYTMVQKAEADAGGLYKLTEDMTSMGVPPNWLSYIKTENTDETAAKAITLGATVLRAPMDVMDIGRMAVIQDPTNAVFALWQPMKDGASAVCNEPGAHTWNELLTTDPDAAIDFYTKLFGWTAETTDMGGFNYTSFMNGDKPAGGMMQITDNMGPIPSNWMVYFGAENADATAKAVTDSGGKVVDGPRDIPEVGRFAVATDPQGAPFAFIQLNSWPE